MTFKIFDCLCEPIAKVPLVLSDARNDVESSVDSGNLTAAKRTYFPIINSIPRFPWICWDRNAEVFRWWVDLPQCQRFQVNLARTCCKEHHGERRRISAQNHGWCWRRHWIPDQMICRVWVWASHHDRVTSFLGRFGATQFGRGQKCGCDSTYHWCTAFEGSVDWWYRLSTR